LTQQHWQQHSQDSGAGGEGGGGGCGGSGGGSGGGAHGKDSSGTSHTCGSSRLQLASSHPNVLSLLLALVTYAAGSSRALLSLALPRKVQKVVLLLATAHRLSGASRLAGNLQLQWGWYSLVAAGMGSRAVPSVRAMSPVSASRTAPCQYLLLLSMAPLAVK
jgi:hypothetical protein